MHTSIVVIGLVCIAAGLVLASVLLEEKEGYWKDEDQY